jgi:hypothetical protein
MLDLFAADWSPNEVQWPQSSSGLSSCISLRISAEIAGLRNFDDSNSRPLKKDFRTSRGQLSTNNTLLVCARNTYPQYPSRGDFRRISGPYANTAKP